MLTITINGKKELVEEHSKVKSLFSDQQRVSYDDNPIVGALVNGDLVSLEDSLDGDAAVEPVLLFSPSGTRIYRHSICFLLCYAVHKLYPQRHLVIGHSLGDGYYFTFDDDYITTNATIDELAQKMKQIVNQALPIGKVKVPYQKAVEYFSSYSRSASSLLLAYSNRPSIELFTVDDFMDLAYEPLVPSTFMLSNWDLMLYEINGMLLRYPQTGKGFKIGPFHDNPLLFSVFKEYRQWSAILGVQSLGQLNEICANGGIRQYIRLSESLQARKIGQIADAIADRPTRAVFIAGPSSSGKTTFAKKLCIQLKMLGFAAKRISLDDYYLPKDQVPRDEDGKPDLEAFEALDIPLFQDNLAALYDGEAVDLPKYDFKNRYYENKPYQLNDSSILVIEGIHALNEKLVPLIEKDTIFKIYISALTQINLDDHNRISTTDNRLIRRLVRDYLTRGASALDTLNMWPSVQRGEKKHIFPNQNNADVILNSALDYELCVLESFAEPLLKTIKPQDGESYVLSRRLLSFLDNIHPVSSDLVPSDSLLREFIGGSEFEE
ncbi:MAG: nucleoside kinase [Sphaerochaetaceae bacterium]|jgi:uridine kinase|nr:nucleoside kinase [Sphaerochaetaceae bacterium]